MEQLTITISETIRVKPYENLKVEVSGTYTNDTNIDPQEFYQAKYRELKKIWNIHLYNLLYNTRTRTENFSDVWEFAQSMISGQEKFLAFTPKKQNQKP